MYTVQHVQKRNTVSLSFDNAKSLYDWIGANESRTGQLIINGITFNRIKDASTWAFKLYYEAGAKAKAERQAKHEAELIAKYTGKEHELMDRLTELNTVLAERTKVMESKSGFSRDTYVNENVLPINCKIDAINSLLALLAKGA